MKKSSANTLLASPRRTLQ